MYNMKVMMQNINEQMKC